MSSRTGQWARALDAATASLKAETDAHRAAFDKAMATLGGSR